MKKINRAFNIALISMLVWVVFSFDLVYSYSILNLRVPVAIDKNRTKQALSSYEKRKKVKIISFIRTTFSGTMVIAKIGNTKYEISCTGVKRYVKKLTFTPEDILDKNGIKIARLVNEKAIGRLFRAVKKEREGGKWMWEWLYPAIIKNQLSALDRRLGYIESRESL